jgi:hypothetical protein
MQTAAAPIDTASAMELLKEATKLVSSTELEAMGAELQRKVDIFKDRCGAGDLDRLSEPDLHELLGLMFTVRSKRRKIIASRPIGKHRAAIAALLHGEGSGAERFAAFTSSYADIGANRARTMASELLHFTEPARYWLWTPWIWDPDTGKGAMSLLVGPGVRFDGTGDAAVYQQVGRATALVARDGQDQGYTRLGRGLLGTDVFLAVVAAISMFTLYKHRISQEFLRFLPEFAELTRRLLGVKHLPEVA